MHTGRYREGIDEPDWVQWKTRLRCALNKATDIVECKEENHIKAEDSDPYKVYEFKPRQREYSSHACVRLKNLRMMVGCIILL